jgi:hypothetical protein
MISPITTSCEYIPDGADASAGARVLISRRNPVRDVILDNGVTIRAGVDGQEIIGHVYSLSRRFIRVLFSEPIPDIEQGAWR